MLTTENAFLNGNRRYTAYIELCMASYLTGACIRMMPSNYDSLFGLITDRTQVKENKLRTRVELELQEVIKDVLVTQYNIPKEVVYDWKRISDFSLGNERQTFPEYMELIPHTVPLDWVSIIKCIEENKHLNEIEHLYLPIPQVSKEDEFKMILSSKNTNYYDLCIIASQFSGYSIRIEKAGTNLINVLGSTVQPIQESAFLKAITEIQEARIEYLKSKGVTEFIEDRGIGLEKYDYPEQEEKIEEPIRLNWLQIAQQVQDIVLGKISE